MQYYCSLFYLHDYLLRFISLCLECLCPLRLRRPRRRLRGAAFTNRMQSRALRLRRPLPAHPHAHRLGARIARASDISSAFPPHTHVRGRIQGRTRDQRDAARGYTSKAACTQGAQGCPQCAIFIPDKDCDSPQQGLQRRERHEGLHTSQAVVLLRSEPQLQPPSQGMAGLACHHHS